VSSAVLLVELPLLLWRRAAVDFLLLLLDDGEVDLGRPGDLRKRFSMVMCVCNYMT